MSLYTPPSHLENSFDLLDFQLILLDQRLVEVLYWAKLLIICFNIILFLCWITCYQCYRYQRFRKSKWSDTFFSDKMLINYSIQHANQTIWQRFCRFIWCPK